MMLVRQFHGQDSRLGNKRILAKRIYWQEIKIYPIIGQWISLFKIDFLTDNRREIMKALRLVMGDVAVHTLLHPVNHVSTVLARMPFPAQIGSGLAIPRIGDVASQLPICTKAGLYQGILC